MASPINYMALIRQKYTKLGFKPYQWVVNEGVPPWKPLPKILSECRVGLIASGGVYVSGQIAYHYRDDTSYRIISKEVDINDLRISHFGYDTSDAREDPNIVFPIGILRKFKKEGIIGDISDRLYSFMGGIYSVNRIQQELAPQLVRHCLSDKVDVIVLVPV